MKIVINKCFGGFGVTEAVFKELGKNWTGYGYLCNEYFNIDSDDYNAYRAHPDLIRAIEIVGIEASTGELAELEILEIPDDVDWYIDEYDGNESIHERHRSWG